MAIEQAPNPEEHWALSDGNCGVLFDRSTLRLTPIGASEADVLDQILSSSSLLDPSSAATGTVRAVLENFRAQDLPNPLTGLTPPDRPSLLRSTGARIRADRYLNKLAINVANDCNLACTYCYANEGLYGEPKRSLLAPDQIDAYIERFAQRFDFIEGVQFMGGEPSMNPSAISRAGATFRRLVDEGRLLARPQYTLVTNGLKFTSGFLDVCKDLDIELTVSLDGPEAIHDVARLRRDRKGSYQAVRESVAVARGAGISVEFEPTFSRAHLMHGMSLIDLVQWFNAEFGVSTLHAPPMSENRYETGRLGLSADEKIREYCAVTEWGIDNLLERHTYLMHSFTARILASFEQRKKNPFICPAGNSLLAISTGGQVSPCWMYTDETQYAMGHVRDADFLGEKADKVSRMLAQSELGNRPACQDCLIQPVCFGCKGGDFHATGTAGERPNCDYMRAMVVTAMMRIFSRPEVPDESQGYYSRPSFGATMVPRLRPPGESRPR